MNYNNRSAGSCSCSVREAMTPFPEDYSVAICSDTDGYKRIR